MSMILRPAGLRFGLGGRIIEIVCMRTGSLALGGGFPPVEKYVAYGSGEKMYARGRELGLYNFLPVK
jgi:hypothetical protein